jgi:hypothetical protein
MKIGFLFLIFTLFLSSCSSTPKMETYSITYHSKGLLKTNLAGFPIFLIDGAESRTQIEEKYSKDVLIIHTGHVLDPKKSKAENENELSELAIRGIDVVNLTLEDFAVALKQNINFDNYQINFLNSTVISLETDSLVTGKNISSYYTHENVAFVGLTDRRVGENLPSEKFIADDYVLSILKIKKKILKDFGEKHPENFIIIHNIGNEIKEVLERLPPSFLNSLAN